MKFFALILSLHILLASLMPGMDTMEFAKFHELYKHYQLHKAQAEISPNASFLDFLDQHYGQAKHSDTHHNHSNLPFKGHHSCPDFTWFSFELRCDLSEISFQAISPKHTFGYASPFVSSFFANIWQPPKI